jgi:hypothetical protein
VAARHSEWDADPSVIAIRSRLHRKLEAMPSLVARWRWLRERQLYVSGLAGFRRDYQDDPAQLIAHIVLFHQRRFPILGDATARWEAFTFPDISVFVLAEQTESFRAGETVGPPGRQTEPYRDIRGPED